MDSLLSQQPCELAAGTLGPCVRAMLTVSSWESGNPGAGDLLLEASHGGIGRYQPLPGDYESMDSGVEPTFPQQSLMR